MGGEKDAGGPAREASERGKKREKMTVFLRMHTLVRIFDTEMPSMM